MYISKAMLNMRGDALGSLANPLVEAPFLPNSYVNYNVAGIQGGGTPNSVEVTAIVVFSAGDTVPDSAWNNQAGALFSLNSLRTYLTANVPGCVMDSTIQSGGVVRIQNLGNGKRTVELNNTIGRFSYAKAFNRMYLMIGMNTTAITTGTATINTVLEFTPQDLIAMGAPLTDNGDGTFNLTGTIVLNNISFS